MNDEKFEKKKALISNQVKVLFSSFDNVQLFVSSFDKETGITSFWSTGEGNVYAREGQIRDWLNSQHKEYYKKDE